jgi:hypothetical protein
MFHYQTKTESELMQELIRALPIHSMSTFFDYLRLPVCALDTPTHSTADERCG